MASDSGPSGGASSRGLGFMGWSQSMRDELSHLPETASNIRRASENLEQVSAELVEVSAMLSQIVRALEAAGVLDGLAMVERARPDIENVRKLLTPPTTVAGAVGKINEAERVVAGMSDRMLKSLGLKRTEPVPLDETPDDPAENGPESPGG